MTLLHFKNPIDRHLTRRQHRLPAVDIVEFDDRFVLSADLPGMAPDDIEISMQDRVLTVRGEHPASAAEPAADQRSHLRERRSGGFTRQFTLPAGVDGDAIVARSEYGTLHIEIPKRPAAEARRINIAAA